MPDTEFTAPVQIVVDTERLLDQIGWRKTHYDEDGPYEQTGAADMRHDLATEVAKILAPTLSKEMRAAVREVVTEAATAQVGKFIDEVFAAGFRKTNAFGEPVGEPVTLRELVIAGINDQLQRQVNGRGGTPDSYDRDRMPYIEYVARKAATEALNGELGQAVTAAVAEVKAGVTNLVSAELAEKITRAVTR